MQKLIHKKLSTGLTIVFITDPRFTTTTLQMTFPFGWRDDTPTTIGLAHLFEHLIGKRTTNYPGKGELTRAMSQHGIQYNATTSPIATVYFQNQLQPNLLMSLSLLLEAIYHSQFTDEDLATEKAIVLTEGKQHQDSPNNLAWKMFAQALFPSTGFSPNANFFFGDETTLANITLETFKEYYKYCRNPHNATLYVAAPDDSQNIQIQQALEEFYQSCVTLTHDVPKARIPIIPGPINHSTYVDKKKSQTTMSIAYRHSPLSLSERAALTVLSHLLLYGLSGKLYRPLRDEAGLIYSMTMSWLSHPDVALIYFQTTCAHDKTNQLIEEFDRALTTIHANLTPQDVDDVRPGLAYQAATEISSYNAVRAANTHKISNDVFVTQEELSIRATRVSFEDVKIMLEKLIETNQRAIVKVD